MHSVLCPSVGASVFVPAGTRKAPGSALGYASCGALRSLAELSGYGPYWARTSDLRLVEPIPAARPSARKPALQLASRVRACSHHQAPFRHVSAGFGQWRRLAAITARQRAPDTSSPTAAVAAGE